ncbi:unnamed protein product [marine sediment metagenome]|uniref:Uncharacterized protein n=1 Tax=marine sediment metagenome TaxID=412755 RepID=X0TIC3_9ZZZZ
MRDKMEAWLIDKAITRNIPPNEITQVQFPKSQTNGDGSFGGGSGFMQQLFGDVKVAGKEFFDMMAIDPIEGENIEGGTGGATMDSTGKKLTARSYTLDPDKAIDILQRYTTGDSFYSTLDNDSIGDLIAKQTNTINSLTEADFTDPDSDYNEYYDSDLSLAQNKKKLIKTQGDIIRTNVKSLTPNDGKARSVIVIRKGELKPTKVKGDIYSVLKEVIENTNYISGKDVGNSLKMLNYVTNENLGDNDVKKWGEFDTFFEETDDQGTIINMDYSSNKPKD